MFYIYYNTLNANRITTRSQHDSEIWKDHLGSDEWKVKSSGVEIQRRLGGKVKLSSYQADIKAATERLGLPLSGPKQFHRYFRR
ncbi:hypothetical protein N7494_001857 [Penicillium frequentans]|uniref:Uncharacterized protein n=1 Tax=Penicillium frequentans TaxID=3151616 RepID=A0AAD6D2T0_9EURO|nr:hypothetical protein N7494_001857 [Penicillium glabrum]